MTAKTRRNKNLKIGGKYIDVKISCQFWNGIAFSTKIWSLNIRRYLRDLSDKNLRLEDFDQDIDTYPHRSRLYLTLSIKSTWNCAISFPMYFRPKKNYRFFVIFFCFCFLMKFKFYNTKSFQVLCCRIFQIPYPILDKILYYNNTRRLD